MAKIIFLGTSGDSIVTGKQLRASGGIIFNYNNMQFHIDPGPGALVRAQQYGINIRETTAILASHNHTNHASSVNALISGMTLNGMDKKGILIANKGITEGKNSFVTEYNQSLLERVINMDGVAKVGINNVDIIKTPVINHAGNGFKITTPEFILSYTSDTENGVELKKAHEDSNIIIINCKHPSGVSQEGHMNVEDVIDFLKATKPSLGIITHFGIKMIQKNPLDETRIIQRESKVQIIAAKDGMEINPKDYSASLKQKKLKSF
jgi:ribonuclease BN (tRNA processing enzyme)